MLIRIDFESETPIYEQLCNEIIKGIAKGELEQGELLPSVRQMAVDIGINMHTVNKSYNMLKSDGYISVDRRKGAIVNGKKSSPSEDFTEKIRVHQENLIAAAICNGMSKGDFLKICDEIYINYSNE